MIFFNISFGWIEWMQWFQYSGDDHSEWLGDPLKHSAEVCLCPASWRILLGLSAKIDLNTKVLTNSRKSLRNLSAKNSVHIYCYGETWWGWIYLYLQSTSIRSCYSLQYIIMLNMYFSLWTGIGRMESKLNRIFN